MFLGSIALVRRAQNEFYENDIQNPLRGLFPFEGGSVANLKDTFDDVSDSAGVSFVISSMSGPTYIILDYFIVYRAISRK